MVYLNCRKGKGGEKMRNKKGFTLIELLAVIVILAIIALIATPVVLGIIEDSRQSAKINSAQFMIDGVQTAYAVAYTKSYEADESKGITAKVAGAVPTLEHIKEAIDFKSAEADIKTDAETGKDYLVTTTNDGAVTCEFKLVAEDDKEVLTSNTCKFTNGEIEETKIGEIGGTETAPADPAQVDPTPGA